MITAETKALRKQGHNKKNKCAEWRQIWILVLVEPLCMIWGKSLSFSKYFLTDKMEYGIR